MARHTETLNSPVFRGGFMNVFEAKKLKQINKETGQPFEGYQITMLFLDGEKLATIKAAATKVLEAEFGPKELGKWPKPYNAEKNPNGYKVPWRDQAQKDKDNTDADKTYDGYKAGNLFMNATTYAVSKTGKENKPFVVDEAVADVIDKKKIYSGAYYIANLNLYWYDNESKGIGVSFNGIQKVDDGEPLGGQRVTAAQVFSPVKVNTKKSADAVMEDEDDPMS